MTGDTLDSCHQQLISSSEQLFVRGIPEKVKAPKQVRDNEHTKSNIYSQSKATSSSYLEQFSVENGLFAVR